MPRNERHVVNNATGGWDVKKPNAERASGHFDTQREAEQRARQILQRSGGGELITHDRANRIRSSDTIAPAKDPCPPRDTEH